MNLTGGGPGSNQYGPRGSARRPKDPLARDLSEVEHLTVPSRSKGVPEVRFSVYLADAADVLDAAAAFVEKRREEFFADPDFVAAGERYVDKLTQTLLEAHRHDPGFRERHPTVPWVQIQGMHVRISKTYWSTSAREVWSTLEESFPELRAELAEEIVDARARVDSLGLTEREVVALRDEADAERRSRDRGR